MITSQVECAITQNPAQQTLWQIHDGARSWRKISYRITKPAQRGLGDLYHLIEKYTRVFQTGLFEELL